MLTTAFARRNRANRLRSRLHARARPCERPLHNALGQRVFKSEPQVDHVAPNATVLGSSFVSWLLANFNWMFATAQTNATLGQSFVYAEPAVGVAALLGEYGNGGVSSTGRREYLWLPVPDGAADGGADGAGQATAIPIGLYRDAALFAVHSDHLATPRRVTDASNLAVWQWPYSPFGDQGPTGVLAPAGTATAVFAIDPASQTNTAARLVTSTPTALNLRFPGQYFDTETGLSYNYFRTYQASQGRYTQADPIGLDGGLNRYSYVGGNPLSRIDPLGLADVVFDRGAGTITVTNGSGGVVGTYPAANNTTASSKGAWPNGTFPYSHYVPHPESGVTGAYGSNGNFVFDVPGRSGMGIHSGRKGPQSPTLGCVRTTDDATNLLRDLHRTDPLRTITVR